MSKSVVSTANERAHQIAGGLSCCYWLSAIHISPTISTQATTESPSIISPHITLLPGVRVGPLCWRVVGGRVGAQTRRQPASRKFIAGGQSFDLVVGSWKPQPLVGPVVGVRACH